MFGRIARPAPQGLTTMRTLFTRFLSLNKEGSNELLVLRSMPTPTRCAPLDSSHSIVMPLGAVVVETNLLRPLEKVIPIMRYHAILVGDADRQHSRKVSRVLVV